MNNLYQDVESGYFDDVDYEIEIKKNPFYFIVKRKSTKEEILNT